MNTKIEEWIEESYREYEEVYYDWNTMTYKTKSQEIENQILQNKLRMKEEDRKKSLKSIIGYFYKR